MTCLETSAVRVAGRRSGGGLVSLFWDLGIWVEQKGTPNGFRQGEDRIGIQREI